MSEAPSERPLNAVPCADRDTDSSMAGTADPVDLWLLLEAPGPWPAQALRDGPLSSDERSWLDSSLRALSAAGIRSRAQLIKQPRAAGDQRRSLLLARNGRGLRLTSDGALPLFPADLVLKLAEQLGRGDLALEAAMALTDVAAQWLDAPQYFVCTNGRRDRCCSRLGMPLYRALRAAHGDRAWQLSHIGGHRFAGNVLTLPDGMLYGRLAADVSAAFSTAIENRQPAFPWLRGRACYTPLVQAAEVFIARPGLKLLHVSGDEAGARVRFADAVRDYQVRLRRTPEPLWVLAGCDKTSLKDYYPFEQLE